MNLALNGKRALVTGSSVGIGEAIARALAAEGAAVAVHGRDQGKAQAVADAIVARSGNAVIVLGDVTDPSAVEEMVADTVRLLGGVDILVNNAGGSGEKHGWEHTPPEDWATAFDRNVLATVRVTHEVLPSMRQAGWGRIVNISSLASRMPPATGPDYSASKAALDNLTVSLAKAVAGEGVTVNAVSPGTILSPKLEERFRSLAKTNGWADAEASWAAVEKAVLPHVAQVPVGHVGSTDDVAHAVAFLCSPLAGYVTGVNLRIDGGAFAAL